VRLRHSSRYYRCIKVLTKVLSPSLSLSSLAGCIARALALARARTHTHKRTHAHTHTHKTHTNTHALPTDPHIDFCTHR
jgi:hypothetical protein